MKPLIPACVAVVLLSGCFESASPAPVPAVRAPESSSAGSDVSITQLPNPSEGITDIEVTLEAPADEVDGFIIRWGSDPKELSQNQRVLVSELKKNPGRVD